jgi:hypothetical protein
MPVKLRYVLPLGALLPAALVALAIACGGGGDAEKTIVIRLPTATATSIPVATPTIAPSPTPTRTPTPAPNVCGANPDDAPASLLQVQEPAPEAKVRNPFHVRGWGSEIAQDNRGVVVAVINAAGKPLPVGGDKDTSKEVPPEPKAGRIAPPGLTTTGHPAPFATDILLTGVTDQSSFCIWVFTETTADGRPLHVVQVPITVVP